MMNNMVSELEHKKVKEIKKEGEVGKKGYFSSLYFLPLMIEKINIGLLLRNL